MPRKHYHAEFLEETRQGRKIIAEQAETAQAWSQPILPENIPLWAAFLIGFSNLVAVAGHINTQTKQQNDNHNSTFDALMPATTREVITETNQILQASLFQTLQQFGKQPLEPEMMVAIKQINTHIKDGRAQTWVNKFAKENKNTIEGLNALREAIGTGQFELAETLIELGVTVDLIIPGQPTPLMVLTNLAQYEEYKPFKKEMKQLFHKIADRESALTPHPILPDDAQKRTFLAKLYYQHSQEHLIKYYQEIHQKEIEQFHDSLARIKPEKVEVPIDAYYSKVKLEGQVYYIRYNPDATPLINSQTIILTFSPMFRNVMDLLEKPVIDIEKIQNILSSSNTGEISIQGESIIFAIRHAQVLEFLKPIIQNFSPIGHFGDTPLAREVHLAALAAHEIGARDYAKHDQNLKKKHQNKLLSSDDRELKDHWREAHFTQTKDTDESKSSFDIALQYKGERDRVLSFIEFYLSNGASLNEKNALGEPLIFDLLQTTEDAYHQFIKKYPVNLAVTNRRGQTPLNFYLKAFADKPFALTLVDMSPGSVIDKPDKDNARPLDHALWAGQEQLCRKLIARGANIEANQYIIRAIENSNDANKKLVLANLRKEPEEYTLTKLLKRLPSTTRAIITVIFGLGVVYGFYALYIYAHKLKKSLEDLAQTLEELPLLELQKKDEIFNNSLADLNKIEASLMYDMSHCVTKIQSIKTQKDFLKQTINAYQEIIDDFFKKTVDIIYQAVLALEEDITDFNATVQNEKQKFEAVPPRVFTVESKTIKGFNAVFLEIKKVKDAVIKQEQEWSTIMKKLDVVEVFLTKAENEFFDCLIASENEKIKQANLQLVNKKDILQSLVDKLPRKLENLATSCLTVPNAVNLKFQSLSTKFQMEYSTDFAELWQVCSSEYQNLPALNAKLTELLVQVNAIKPVNQMAILATVETCGTDPINDFLAANHQNIAEVQKSYAIYDVMIKALNEFDKQLETPLAEIKKKETNLGKRIKTAMKLAEPTSATEEEQVVKVKEVAKTAPRKKTEEEKRIEKEQRKVASEEEEKIKLKNEEEEKKNIERAERIQRQAEIANFLRMREPHIQTELKNLNQIKEYIDNIKGLMDVKFFVKERFYDSGDQKKAISKRMQFYALLYGLIRTAEYLNKLHAKYPFNTTRISYHDYYIRNNLMHRGFYLNQNPEQGLLPYASILLNITYPVLNALIKNELQESVSEDFFTVLYVKNLYGKAIKGKEQNCTVIFENLKSYLADMKILAEKIKGMDAIGKIEKFTISNDIQYAAKGLLLLIAQRLRDLNRYSKAVYQDFYNSLTKDGQFFLNEIFKLRNEIGHSNTEAGWEDDAMNALYFYEEILPSMLKTHCMQINTHLASVFTFKIATQPLQKYGVFASSSTEIEERKLELAEDEYEETMDEESQWLAEKFGVQ